MKPTRLLFTPGKMLPLAGVLLVLGLFNAPGRLYDAMSMDNAFAKGTHFEVAALRLACLASGAGILALWAAWRAGAGGARRRALEDDFRAYAAAPAEPLPPAEQRLRLALFGFCLLILGMAFAAIAMSGQGGEGFKTTGETMTLQKRSWDNLKGMLMFLGALALLIAAVRRRRAARWGGWALVMPCFMAFLYIWAAGETYRWGQYLLHFEPPDAVAKINFQGEMTLHNIGGYWANHAQILYFFLYVTVLPLLAWFFTDVRYLCERLMAPVGSLLLVPFGIVGNLFSDSASFRWLWGTPGLAPSEGREALFCACILAISVQTWVAWRRRYAAAPSVVPGAAME